MPLALNTLLSSSLAFADLFVNSFPLLMSLEAGSQSHHRHTFLTGH